MGAYRHFAGQHGSEEERKRFVSVVPATDPADDKSWIGLCSRRNLSVN